MFSLNRHLQYFPQKRPLATQITVYKNSFILCPYC
ncbi:hypothetical protein MHA_1962 [Mannheimia haemolytica PHL213]|nr:hypothetical protein MHA_1962 [Mannheimia haemolytica PHL213]